jgi:carbamoyl-phosphate synthase small subunit
MIKLANQGKECLNSNLVETVTCTGPRVIGKGKPRIVLMDFGVKQNIINSLVARDCQVVIVPARTTFEQIMAVQPHGVVLSNGPGNPEACMQAVEEIKKLLGQVPVFGICLGHQLLGLSLGCRTYKLKFGHRGGNHTVQDTQSGRCYISSQNHGYAVDPDSLPQAEAAVSFINLNDGTVEGLVHKKYPAMSVQFHPEATPGPHDTAFLFDEFLQLVKTWPGLN